MKENSFAGLYIDYEILDEFLNSFTMEVTHQAVNTLSRKQCDSFMEWFNYVLEDSLTNIS